MATGLRIDAPTLAGEYQEAIGNRLATGLGNLAPIVYLSAPSGRYFAPSDDGVIKQRENGFDPLVPVGFDSPAREISQKYKEIDFRPKKFFEFMFENDVEATAIAEAIGSDVRRRQNDALSRLAADRIEWMVSKVYQDPTNYAAGATSVDLNDGPSALIEAIETAVGTVRPANNRSDEYVINVVLGTKLLSRLRRELAPLASKDALYLSGNSLETLLSDQLDANVKIFSSASQFEANASGTTQAAAREAMWDDMFMSVTASAVDAAGLPTFVHMPAFDVAQFRGRSNAGQQYLTPSMGDEYSRLANMFAVDWHNPPGARTYCESFFDVVVGDKNRGVLFTVTDSGA